MKTTIISVSVLILATLIQGIAVAAPGTQSVLGMNTSRAAVPVTLGNAPVNVQQATRQTVVLFSGPVDPNGHTVDVSACAQIRVTASVGKDQTGGFVFLEDVSVPETAPDLFAAVIMPLGIPDNAGYASMLLETPGMKLSISGKGDPSAVIYCR